MVYTEFVSADALIRNVSKTQQKLNVSDEERPVAIQIYGKEVGPMVEAAQICEVKFNDNLLSIFILAIFYYDNTTVFFFIFSYN